MKRVEEEEVLDDVGAAEEPVDAGVGERHEDALEERAPVRHRQRAVAGLQHPPRRVVGRGTLTWSNGDRWEGEFDDAKMRAF